MGQFQLGQIKPPGSGRKKGTPNKKSQSLSEILNAHDFNVPEKLIELLPQLSAERQADLLLDLMGYLYPKRKPMADNPQDNGPQCIKIEFVEDGTTY
ncbi:MAG: hypothetical protein ACXVCY_15020 [Pseudobdellovibrionaceae bacterium]